MTKKLDGAVVGRLRLTYDTIIGHLLKWKKKTWKKFWKMPRYVWQLSMKVWKHWIIFRWVRGQRRSRIPSYKKSLRHNIWEIHASFRWSKCNLCLKLHTIFVLKMMVRSGLEKYILKSFHALNYFYLLHTRKDFFPKITNSVTKITFMEGFRNKFL